MHGHLWGLSVCSFGAKGCSSLLAPEQQHTVQVLRMRLGGRGVENESGPPEGLFMEMELCKYSTEDGFRLQRDLKMEELLESCHHHLQHSPIRDGSGVYLAQNPPTEPICYKKFRGRGCLRDRVALISGSCFPAPSPFG